MRTQDMNEHEYKHTHTHARTLNNTYTAVGTSTLLAFSYKLRLAHESISLYFCLPCNRFSFLFFFSDVEPPNEQLNNQTPVTVTQTETFLFIFFLSPSSFLFWFLCVGFYSAQYTYIVVFATSNKFRQKICCG